MALPERISVSTSFLTRLLDQAGLLPNTGMAGWLEMYADSVVGDAPTAKRTRPLSTHPETVARRERRHLAALRQPKCRQVPESLNSKKMGPDIDLNEESTRQRKISDKQHIDIKSIPSAPPALPAGVDESDLNAIALLGDTPAAQPRPGWDDLVVVENKSSNIPSAPLPDPPPAPTSPPASDDFSTRAAALAQRCEADAKAPDDPYAATMGRLLQASRRPPKHATRPPKPDAGTVVTLADLRLWARRVGLIPEISDSLLAARFDAARFTWDEVLAAWEQATRKPQYRPRSVAYVAQTALGMRAALAAAA